MSPSNIKALSEISGVDVRIHIDSRNRLIYTFYTKGHTYGCFYTLSKAMLFARGMQAGRKSIDIISG